MYQVHIMDKDSDFSFAATKNAVFSVLTEALEMPHRWVRVSSMKTGETILQLDARGLQWPLGIRHEEINVLGLLAYRREV